MVYLSFRCLLPKKVSNLRHLIFIQECHLEHIMFFLFWENHKIPGALATAFNLQFDRSFSGIVICSIIRFSRPLFSQPGNTDFIKYIYDTEFLTSLSIYWSPLANNSFSNCAP
jgi:hypothetical protein